MSGRNAFGSKVRKTRIEQDYGLREFAGKIDVSPTYLSKIERGEFDPPSEKTINAIARELGLDPEELMAVAGKMPSELEESQRETFQQYPKEMATFLRTAKEKGLTGEDIKKLTKSLKRS